MSQFENWRLTCRILLPLPICSAQNKEESLSAQGVVISGLVVNAIGVVMLFFFGMPFRVALKEGEIITTSTVTSDVARLDARYRKLGNFGLFFIISGTALQIYGAVYF